MGYTLIDLHGSHKHDSLSIVRLLGKERNHELNREQQVFARDEDNGLSLLDVVKKYKPTILLGVTAVGGKTIMFAQKYVTQLGGSLCSHSIHFPFRTFY